MAVTELRVRGLVQLAIADQATTPNPGSEGWAWSTTLDGPVYWDGSKWNATRGITVGTTAPPTPHLNQLWLDTN